MNLIETLNKCSEMRQGIKEAVAKGEEPKIKETSVNLLEKMARNVTGDYSKGKASIQEALMTTDTVKLIPKIIEGQLREGSEPELLATKFMHTVNVDGGNSAVYVIPVIGEVTAHEVGETTKYNESVPEFTTLENQPLEIRVKKIGCKISISEEAISDSSWDILGINTRKMGKAMARYKEEWIFNTFTQHGHQIFDNDIRDSEPEFGTTGKDEHGQYNDTLSVEDFLDLVLALMANGFNPTDIIMHPLTWVVFARNSMIGNGLSFGALGGQNISPYGTVQGKGGFAGLPNDGSGQQYIMSPDQVQGRLPMPINVNFSPFINFDKTARRFDMYCIDRAEVGVIAQREGLSTDNWTDPERDIRALKCKERYGVGVLNNGRAITVCRNIAVAPSYPTAPSVTINTKTV